MAPVFLFSQNIVDSNGKKQGFWNKYHLNGKLKYSGEFKNNFPVGIFKYYDNNENLKADLIYFNNGKSASAKLYYSNGKLSAVGLYSSEKKDSLWKYYNEEEKLVAEEYYSSGKLNGKSISYYLNGNILEIIIKMV